MNWRDIFLIALAVCVGLIVLEVICWWRERG